MSNGTLEGFYEWCKEKGHFRANETVDRYRAMLLTEENTDVIKNDGKDIKRVNGAGTG